MSTFIKDIYTEEELWLFAKLGNISILKDKNVAQIRNDYLDTPLHRLVQHNNSLCFYHPEINIPLNTCSCTPLCYLASCGNLLVLEHPELLITKSTKPCNFGHTPLMHLASAGVMEVARFPEIFTLKSLSGLTPYYWLVNSPSFRKNNNLENLKKVFPEYPYFNNQDSFCYKTLKKVYSLNNSIKFIFSE